MSISVCGPRIEVMMGKRAKQSDEKALIDVDINIDLPKELGETVVMFAQTLIGPVSEIANFLTDKIRYQRWRSMVKTIQQAKEFSEEWGINPKQVPLKILIPILEKASLEEENSDMIEKWAGLLANASDDPHTKHARYASMLAETSPEEAELLERLWLNTNSLEIFRFHDFVGNVSDWSVKEQIDEIANKNDLSWIEGLAASGRIIFNWREDDIPNTNEMSLFQFDMATEAIHLQSLGLVYVYTTSFLIKGKREFVMIIDITAFGYDFVDAFHGPDE